MKNYTHSRQIASVLLLSGMLWTILLYSPGLQGQFLFDDYPNIVDNKAVQPEALTWSNLVAAALSSPSSELKRPLASLSFALNYAITGLDPYWMKLTNLLAHLLNGLLVYLMAGVFLRYIDQPYTRVAVTGRQESPRISNAVTAALIAVTWMVLPINLTGVLYIVQRMESMANVFVLLGIIGYVHFRAKMLHEDSSTKSFLLGLSCIVVCTAVGVLFKETAVMLPLYAFICEAALFEFRSGISPNGQVTVNLIDKRVVWMFVLILLIPFLLGSAWIIPHVLKQQSWETRTFTLGTRLLSEARIVVDYAIWTLLPTREALSFYHDNFEISQGFTSPPTTLLCVLLLAAVIGWLGFSWRRPRIATLGITLFLAAQLLTGTVLPLELIYEHRNYFASAGLMLALVPTLTTTAPQLISKLTGKPTNFPRNACLTLLAGLMLIWSMQTAQTAYAWGSPLRLAEDFADRNPKSPRAMYELGRTYIIYSQYVPSSPFVKPAFSALERAAALPGASILPEQALIFASARMHMPQEDAWWDTLIVKLRTHPVTVQDESSLASLSQCQHEGRCDLSKARMMEAFGAALSHPNPTARLLATYSEFAWNVLNDRALGERMIREAISVSPSEVAYRITLARMLIAENRIQAAREQIDQIHQFNIGNHLDSAIDSLNGLIARSSHGNLSPADASSTR